MRKLILTALIFASSAISVSAGDLPLPPPPPLPRSSGDNAGAADLPTLPVASTDNLLPPLPGFDSGALNAGASASDFAFGDSAAADDHETGGALGTIIGGRVHIRAGDNTKFEIVHTADTGMNVRVFEKKGDWVQIAFPAEESCFIEQRAIDGDIPVDIPDQGAVRPVRANTKVYVRSWSGSTVVGELKGGDNVVITGMRGQFLRIKPPYSARAWVFGKYVKYDGTNVETVELSPEEQAAKAQEQQLREAVDNAKNAGIASGESRVLSAHRNDPLLVKIRERNAQERALREQQREQAKNLIANLDKTLAAIDADAAARLDEVSRSRVDDARQDEQIRRSIEDNYRPGPPPGSLGNSATGWIEHVGYWRNRPAEYRLVKGRETVCYLRSNRFNLGDYNGRHVVVSGSVSASAIGAGEILQVETLRLFDQTAEEVPPTVPPYVSPARTPSAEPVFYSGNVGFDETLPTTNSGRAAYPEPYSSRQATAIPYDDNLVRDSNGNPMVAGYRTTPVLQQNENVIIIEDNPDRAISTNRQWLDSNQLQPGQVIDITGMPTIGQ